MKSLSFLSGAILSAVIFFPLGFFISTENYSEDPGARALSHNSAKNGAHTDSAPSLQVFNLKSVRSEERKENSGAVPIRALEDFAQESPELAARLKLVLFDSDLNPLPNNWAFLKVDPEQIKELHERLLKISEKIKEEELKNFTVVESSGEMLRVVLPPIPEASANGLKKQIDDAFLASFPPHVAAVFSRNFLDSNISSFAGLQRLNRIATLKLTSEDIYQQTGRKYILDIRTLTEFATVENALKDINAYSSVHSDQFLDEIPAVWTHLFKNN